MNYDNLDINQRINIKGLVQAWLNISVERFQEELDKKLYSRRSGLIKGSEQRDSKGRFVKGSGKYKSIRTRELRNNWRSSLSSAGNDVAGARMSFLEYGRFVDMGVGKGTSYALSKYQAIRRNGERRTRKPVRWYSRRKGYEMHRLRELLTKYHIDITLDVLENALTTHIEIDA